MKLGDYFGKKPVILVLAYYRCPMLCTLVLNGLVQGMRDMPFTVGKEFNVVTVSFDPRETPDLAAAKKKTYIASYGRPGAAEGWHFLTGKPEAIEKLTSAVGFRYVYDAKHDQYIHTSGIMILTPQGKISRYFYGIQFPGRDLRLGLVESVGQQDRLADRPGSALLLSLRPGRRKVHGEHPEFRANRRRADDRRGGRHGVVLWRRGLAEEGPDERQSCRSEGGKSAESRREMLRETAIMFAEIAIFRRKTEPRPTG